MDNNDFVLFDKKKVSDFQNFVKTSSYFLEVIHQLRAKATILSFELLHNLTLDKEVWFNIFNPNLCNFISKKLLYTQIFEKPNIYSEKYLEGYNSFVEYFNRFNPANFQTWNAVFYKYENVKKRQLLDEREIFNDAEILECFYDCGYLMAQWDYELDNSLLMMQYFNLKISDYSVFRVPLKNNYTLSLPPNNTTKIIAKVEFIILKEMGVIDQITAQNHKGISKIIAEKINERYRDCSIEKPCTEEYIQNMLSADKYLPDYTNPKSAYKKHNITKAIKELEKLGIGIEDCKYLPKLRKENPELF